MRARWRAVYPFFTFLVLATVLAVACPLGGRVREQTGWRGALARFLHRHLIAPVARLLRAAYRRVRPHREPPPDPFEVLHLQTRLGAVADEIRALQFDGQVYARAARLEARADAYDALLAEACEMAGVDLEPADPRRSGERMRREVELASRGWSW